MNNQILSHNAIVASMENVVNTHPNVENNGIMERSGITVHMANGYSVSIQNGGGLYCNNYHAMRCVTDKDEITSFEVAVLTPDGGIMPNVEIQERGIPIFDDCSDVAGWVSFENCIQIITAVGKISNMTII